VLYTARRCICRGLRCRFCCRNRACCVSPQSATVAGMTVAIFIGCAVACYFLGSIPTGFLWAKGRGIDIRKVGSGNIGATNVMRALGKGPGAAVLFLDAAKGFLPVFVAPRIFLDIDQT